MADINKPKTQNEWVSESSNNPSVTDKTKRDIRHLAASVLAAWALNIWVAKSDIWPSLAELKATCDANNNGEIDSLGTYWVTSVKELKTKLDKAPAIDAMHAISLENTCRRNLEAEYIKADTEATRKDTEAMKLEIARLEAEIEANNRQAEAYDRQAENISEKINQLRELKRLLTGSES